MSLPFPLVEEPDPQSLEKGRLLLLAAGTATSTRERHTMATSARASLQRAIELNPMLERKLNGVLQHARSLSGAK